MKTSEPATATTHDLMPVSKCSSNLGFLFLKTGLSLWKVIIMLLRTKYSTTEIVIFTVLGRYFVIPTCQTEHALAPVHLCASKDDWIEGAPTFSLPFLMLALSLQESSQAL